jgi:HK97 family phage major capsid protein
MSATAVDKIEALTKSVAELSGKLDKPNYGHGATWEDSGEEVNIVVGGDASMAKGLPVAGRRRGVNMKSLVRQHGYKPCSEFKSFADFIRTGMSEHKTAAFASKVEAHLAPITKATKAIQGMNETSGPDGGYSVMPEFASGIIERLFTNDLFGRTDGYTVAGNNMTFLANAENSRANGSRAGGVQGYWVSEGGTITKSKPTMREITLKLKKLAVLVYLSDEAISDSGLTLEQYVTRKAADEFAFMLGDAVFNGSGVGMPLGVLNSPSLLSIAKESGQLANTVYTENIEKMYARFFMPNMPSATWYHNQDIQSQLGLMTLGVGTGGVPTYLPPGGLSAAPYGTLKGRPLQPTEFNATLGTQGDLVLADLKQLLSITKGGIEQAVSMHVEFLTDQTALRFIMRADARPWENAPLTPFKGTNTQSSFVALDTRA